MRRHYPRPLLLLAAPTAIDPQHLYVEFIDCCNVEMYRMILADPVTHIRPPPIDL